MNHVRLLLIHCILVATACGQVVAPDASSSTDASNSADAETAAAEVGGADAPEVDAGCVSYARPTGTCGRPGTCCVSSTCVSGICVYEMPDAAAPVESGLACALTNEACRVSEDCCNRRHECRGVCNY